MDSHGMVYIKASEVSVCSERMRLGDAAWGWCLLVWRQVHTCQPQHSSSLQAGEECNPGTGLASQISRLLGQGRLERQCTLGAVVLQDSLGNWQPAITKNGKRRVPASCPTSSCCATGHLP